MGFERFLTKHIFIRVLKGTGDWYAVGEYYETGEYEPINLEKAAHCYQKAIDNNRMVSQAAFRLGIMYENGEGVPRSYSKAAKYYKIVIDHGIDYPWQGRAQNNLGVLYKNGEGVVRNKDEAIRLFKLAKVYTSKDNSCIEANLLDISGDGYRYPNDIERATKFCVEHEKISADQKNPIAQCKLANRYQNGDGVKKDEKKAFKLYQLAAEQANSEGQFQLAHYFDQGYYFVTKDPQKAINLYTLAAEQGHYEAKQALEEKVEIQANKGDAKAQYQLAVMCLHSKRSPYGGQLSRITELSAEQGYAKAQYLLGLLYECGKYVPEGYPISEIFGPMPSTIPNNFEPSPDCLFLMESGPPADYDKAIKWFTLAVKQGHEKAKQRLKNLDPNIEAESLISIKDPYNESIQGIIINKKINSVVHFTRIENLDSILSNGLLTRGNILESDTISIFNDEYRFDKQENSVSCSIEFPNYKMFYKLQQENPGTKWIVILLDPSLFREKECAFSTTNAANASASAIPIEQRKGADALWRMFYDSEDRSLRSKLRLPPNYPTDPQAEVLVLDNVETKYINGIVTSDEKTAIELSEIYPEFKFIHDKTLFSPRMDYDYWR